MMRKRYRVKLIVETDTLCEGFSESALGFRRNLDNAVRNDDLFIVDFQGSMIIDGAEIVCKVIKVEDVEGVDENENDDICEEG